MALWVEDRTNEDSKYGLSLGSLLSKELKAMELNKDLVIAEILLVPPGRIPKELSDTNKEEQCRRSIAMANLEEADAQLRPPQCHCQGK